ncbi:MAG TPA: DUF5658 family protein [Planctomicrobium sp.]|nr:DUF5658 family protein [Planctomicrobium sp.]
MTQEPLESPEVASKSPIRSINWYHFAVRRQLPLETETAVFILVNMLDYLATYSLLVIVGGFRESNPIALWFLEGWGPVKGLLIYKMALVTTVCLTTQLIYLERPWIARAILVAGSIGVFCVVIYSVLLYINHGEGTVGLPLDFLD